jgi:3-oxoacyl-[acyl-carrier-protein] synthase-3
VTVLRSVVLGCGSYLPTLTSDLALHAARAALANAHVEASSIDLIVLATSTPDQTFPATAVSVQAGLGITHGAAFDLQAVCSGFVYALQVTDSLLRNGAYKRALVIGAETFSRILDWNDRTTCVLFGDGAGALVLEAQPSAGAREDRGILTTHLRSDGRHKAKLYVDGGPSSTQTVGHLRMEGREVFKHAVAMITDVIEDAFKATGYAAGDIRPTNVLSMDPPINLASRRRRSSLRWIGTATRRLHQSRSLWPMQWQIGALNAEI